MMIFPSLYNKKRNKISRIIATAMSSFVICVIFFAVAMMSTGDALAASATSSGGTSLDSLYTPRYLPDIIQGATGPAEMIFFVYKYLMGLVGIIAVGVIMYAGILYTVSADPGKIKQSNEYIRSALKGIVLLFGAQVLFNTINPNIIALDRIQKALLPGPKLEQKTFTPTNLNLSEDATSTQTQQGAINQYGGLPGFAPLAAKIKPCADCQPIGFGNNFQVKSGACIGATCQLNKGLVSALDNLGTIAKAGNIQWRVTEGYPPTVNHQSDCHFDGTCVDIGLTSGMSAAKVNAFINAAKAAGLNVVNEYSVGANPQHFDTTTGGHLHVRL